MGVVNKTPNNEDSLNQTVEEGQTKGGAMLQAMYDKLGKDFT